MTWSGSMLSIHALTLLVCFLPTAQGADDENPYRKSKVGDWVEYKMTGTNVEGKTKMTIVAKDDKELTYEVAGTFSFMGNQTVAPIQTLKIDLTKSYDPIVSANMKANGATLEKAGEGKEKLKVGDKEYDTKWTRSKITTTAGGVTVVTDTKFWFCKDVPLSGMVKMESTVMNFTTLLELVGSGSK
jgi:hypothetical protein